MNQFVLLVPILSVLIGGLTLMFMSMYSRFKTKDFIIVSSLFLLVALGFTLADIGNSFSVTPFADIFNNILIIDSFSIFFNSLLIFGTLLTVLIGEKYYEKNSYFKGEFFALILFALFGMMLLANVNEFITAYIALEIASFAVYVMVGLNTEDGRRVEAVFKYLVLGSLMGGFFLLGTVLIYGLTGTTNLTEISNFISANQNADLSLMYIGISLVLFTFLFKIAAFPFHSWVLDVYRGAPMHITAFMASTFKVAVFSFFLRAFLKDFAELQDFWDDMIFVLIIFTLAYGTWLALSQKIVKKMLAASSIVHTGYLLIAFMAIGGSHNESAYAMMFYLIAYMLSAVGSFGLISHIISETGVKVTYDDFKGLAKQRPFLAGMMTICLFSLAGIPSTIGFIAKFYVFTEAINAGYVSLAIIGIFATIVSVFYYFRLIAMMYFYPPANEDYKPEYNNTRISTLTIGLVVFMIVWGGIGSAVAFLTPIPSIDSLISLAEISVKSLFLN